MAKSKKIESENSLAELLKETLNNKFKSSNANIAAILGDDFQTAADVKYWISTGSELLNLAISNRINGGHPTGRIIEITGLEAAGKSLLAAYAIANVQKMGGVGILIDTESAISRDFLQTIGVDLNNMIYAQLESLEDVFQSIEYLLEILDEQLQKETKPIVIVVDSVAAATTKQEQASEYDKDGYATSKAIILSKAMRKITNLIAKKNVSLIMTNQLRMKVGGVVGWGDPYCVDPYTTMVTIRYEYKPGYYANETMSIDRFSDLYCNNDDFENPEEFDVEDRHIEIESTDINTGETIWNPIKTFIIKNPVDKYFTDGSLNCSQNHKLYSNVEKDFIKAKKHPDFKQINEKLHIVDFELGGNHTYLANGRLNHNTTSGGKAIGFHSSVRIRLKQMGQIKAKVNGVDQVVGIKTRAQVIKNRVGPPFKNADFNIYFDSGINETDAIIELCKNYGIIQQAGAWGTFVNTDTGEEIKFQAKTFEEKILNVEHNKKFIYDKIAEYSIVKYKQFGEEEVIESTFIEE